MGLILLHEVATLQIIKPGWWGPGRLLTASILFRLVALSFWLVNAKLYRVFRVLHSSLALELSQIVVAKNKGIVWERYIESNVTGRRPLEKVSSNHSYHYYWNDSIIGLNPARTQIGTWTHVWNWNYPVTGLTEVQVVDASAQKEFSKRHSDRQEIDLLG